MCFICGPAIALEVHIQEVLGTYFVPVTGYPENVCGFIQSLQANAEKVGSLK
jgi:hypothetical protein